MEQVHSRSSVPINSKSPHPGLGFLTTFHDYEAACHPSGWGQRTAHPVCVCHLEGRLRSLLHLAKALQLDAAMGTPFRRPRRNLLSAVCVLGPQDGLPHLIFTSVE